VQLTNPRPLSDAEKKITLLLLSREFPGAQELRAQVDHAQVVGECDCGCPTIDIEVAEAAPRSLPQSGAGPLPYEGSVASDGEDPAGGIILFSSNGYINSLEYYPMRDPSPPDWPDLTRIEVVGPLR
jgi:hypothetical protein